MMKRFFVILISCLWLAVPLFAQSNKLIRELESKRGALQKQIAESESILKDTKKDVGSQLNSLAVLTGQIEERKRYIMAINKMCIRDSPINVRLLRVVKVSRANVPLLRM